MKVRVYGFNRKQFNNITTKLEVLMRKYNKEYSCEVVETGNEVLFSEQLNKQVSCDYTIYDVVFESINLNVEYLGCIKYVLNDDVYTPQIYSEIDLREYENGVSCNCDSCNTTRNRVSQFIFKQSNEIKRIGSSCVKAYFGFDYKEFTFCLNDLNQLNEQNPTEKWLQRQKHVNSLNQILSCLSYVSDSFKAKYDKDNTPSLFSNNLSRFKDAKELENYKELKNKIEEYWLKKNLENSFNFNAKHILINSNNEVREMFEERYNKIIICAILRALNPTQEKKVVQEVGNYLGNLKDKLTLNVRLEEYRTFNSCFDGYNNSIVYWLSFRDNKNNLIMVSTSSDSKFVNNVFENEEIKQFKIAGTVKRYKLYKNEKQTWLTRCKIIKEI